MNKYFQHSTDKPGSSVGKKISELVAKLIQLYGLLDAKKALEGGKQSAFVKGGSEAGGAKR